MRKKDTIVILLFISLSTISILQGCSVASNEPQTSPQIIINHPNIDDPNDNDKPYIPFVIGPRIRSVNHPVLIFFVIRDPDPFDQVRGSVWWKDRDWEMTPYKTSPGFFFCTHVYTKKGDYEIRVNSWDEHNELGSSGSCLISII